jgi:FeS assembly SUF system protein
MTPEEIETEIVKMIKTIYDPEIPVDIFELGLIYEIRVSEEKDVEVIMTLTSPSCPEAEIIPGTVEMKVAGVPEVKSVKVTLTFDPPWTKEMMSEEAQLELGFM